MKFSLAEKTLYRIRDFLTELKPAVIIAKIRIWQGFLTGVILGVGDSVHGQDVAIVGGDPVGLCRIALGSDQLDLQQEDEGTQCKHTRNTEVGTRGFPPPPPPHPTSQ